MLAWVEDIYNYCEDFLDEECFDVNLECDYFDAVSLAVKSCSLSNVFPSGEKVLVEPKKNIKTGVSKSNVNKSGSKLQKGLIPVSPTVPLNEPVTPVIQTVTTTATSTSSSSSSRRAPQMKMYLYPSFDKSDSSLFLPSRLAKHLNSGNMASVSKLIQLHFDKNCKIEMDFLNCNNMSPKALIKWYAFIQEIHADSIMCVRQTTVSENQIQSIVYIKFTDNRFLDASVRARVKDPALKRVLEMEKPNKRENPFRREDYPEEEYKRLEAIVNSDEDKIVYITQEMTLTIDEMTSKVKGFRLVNRTTNLVIAPPVPDGFD